MVTPPIAHPREIQAIIAIFVTFIIPITKHYRWFSPFDIIAFEMNSTLLCTQPYPKLSYAVLTGPVFGEHFVVNTICSIGGPKKFKG